MLLSSHLVLRDDFCVVVQNVTKHVTTHALSRLVVKVLKEGVKMFQFQDSQNIVVRVNRYLQKSGELLRNCTAGGNATERKTGSALMTHINVLYICPVKIWKFSFIH